MCGRQTHPQTTPADSLPPLQSTNLVRRQVKVWFAHICEHPFHASFNARVLHGDARTATSVLWEAHAHQLRHYGVVRHHTRSRCSCRACRWLVLHGREVRTLRRALNSHRCLLLQAGYHACVRQWDTGALVQCTYSVAHKCDAELHRGRTTACVGSVPHQ